MGLINLVSILAFWGVLMVKADDPYIYLDWTVKYGKASPLGPHGPPQQVILINDQFPGPTINCSTNDNLIINVFNMLDEPFLLTWNGIKQRKNCWQDGVLGTNCPIPPNNNYTYKFQTKDQIGSYTYFPTIGMQRVAGGFGALNVMTRSVVSVPYPEPAEKISLLISDWYNITHQELKRTLDEGKELPPPNAILINGESGYSFTGVRGETYMFRVSNIGVYTSFNFRIQGHKLKIVEVEGCHVNQDTFDSLDVFVGQTVTVLVTLDGSPTASYYIVASSTFTDMILNATAVMYFGHNTSVENPFGQIPPAANGNVSWSMNQTKSIRRNLTSNAARPNAQGSFHYESININKTYILENSELIINGSQRYAVNNISYINPNTSLKLAQYNDKMGVYNITFPQDPSESNYYKQGTYVLPAFHHYFVEIVFQNNDPKLQSWHLDGYDFFVVGMGRGKWTSASRNGTEGYNMHDAITRHTVEVYPNSWTAIYVSLDNQGMWNLRSAMWGKQYLGQQLYITVHGEESVRNEYPKPTNAITCGYEYSKPTKAIN